mmetsp:Transcript_90230/g.254585  ORF Transcript_90230/g.254585 Transcript_90230/m.254585 type:complete len:178 (+) Transcript_90230:980-1513(+)
MLEDLVDKLRRKGQELTYERDELQRTAIEASKERKALVKERDEWQKKASEQRAPTERRSEKECTRLLADAIQSKLEFHICLPQVTLTYNDAPPLKVSTTSALTHKRVREFVNDMVLPCYEPLWLCFDAIDYAPDGSTATAYSERVLDLLTDAVTKFVEKSQKHDRSGAVPIASLRSP